MNSTFDHRLDDILSHAEDALLLAREIERSVMEQLWQGFR